jgi:hypothetical protein
MRRVRPGRPWLLWAQAVWISRTSDPVDVCISSWGQDGEAMDQLINPGRASRKAFGEFRMTVRRR